MTLLHTAGYFEVLESVKKRAEKRAKDMARMAVSVEFMTLLKKLPRIAHTQVTLAGDAVDGDGGGSFTIEEDDELYSIFTEEFLHHYRFELEQMRSEKMAEEERAAMCSVTCGARNERPCDVAHLSGHHETQTHRCAECF